MSPRRCSDVSGAIIKSEAVGAWIQLFFVDSRPIAQDFERLEFVDCLRFELLDSSVTAGGRN